MVLPLCVFYVLARGNNSFSITSASLFNSSSVVSRQIDTRNAPSSHNGRPPDSQDRGRLRNVLFHLGWNHGSIQLLCLLLRPRKLDRLARRTPCKALVRAWWCARSQDLVYSPRRQKLPLLLRLQQAGRKIHLRGTFGVVLAIYYFKVANLHKFD